ncbi:MAG: hypothetical protein IPM82_29735 [Saprospiraceae bacterium]|nr:hypothetical protein [Saprospiraceae bacterium]
MGGFEWFKAAYPQVDFKDELAIVSSSQIFLPCFYFQKNRQTALALMRKYFQSLAFALPAAGCLYSRTSAKKAPHRLHPMLRQYLA